jgi:hypothetical protein
MAHVSGKLVSFTKAIATLAMILTMAGLGTPILGAYSARKCD